ncbi:alkaline phosphatase D family protein [Kribbella sp. NPDC051718]|uniref:alkaline phosphatase D family protein n=1 Tax=Kribbella sp. NPDC051718 TaxID=3155168 RepID=UPI0034226B37
MGVFDAEEPERLEWSLNGNPIRAGDIREVRALTRVPLPDVVSQMGVFEVPVSEVRLDRPLPDTVEVAAVWADGRRKSYSLTTRPLPGRLPFGLGETFNVLAVSCFYEPGDSSGRAGELVASLSQNEATRPDLVIAMGDQVYLDSPYFKSQTLYSQAALAKAFEVKYRRNWQGLAYARILRAAPVASIPDDHEYWNNYPQSQIFWPTTMFGPGRGHWELAARELFDGFQLAETNQYSYRIDVPPLSFFMLDNRTFRTVNERHAPGQSARSEDLALFDRWVCDVIGSSELLPVLVTGPSLFQPAKTKFAKYKDQNLANLRDYPRIMEGLLKLSSHGRPPLALTGDVHYGRVISAAHWTGNRDRPWSNLYEVISSPASVVALRPRPDGKRSEAEPPKQRFRVEGTAEVLDCVMQWPTKDADKMGDHVTLLQFSRTQTGVDVDTLYWMINEPGKSMNPIRAPRMSLRRL